MNNAEIVLSVISVTLLVLLLVSAVVIVFFISARQRLKQQMELSRAKVNYEKELRLVETEVSEQVMGQFAQELHDNIGQLITAMHIQIENQKIDHPVLTEGFRPLEIYLAEVTQQLRLLSRTLNNDYIGNIGLLAAIDTEITRIKALRRFDVHWKMVLGSSNLEKDQELMVFRVFQEITQNALRHSMAKNLYVEINNSDNAFELTVRDDGRGFDYESILKSQKASGLNNILKRAKWAGMNCQIISKSGEGCKIVLKKDM